MLASLLIVFREALEAGLIVGIVLAATVGVPRRGLWVAGGVAAGALGATVVAGFAGVIADALQGVGQEVFTAAILLAAVVMLAWHNTWMAAHGRELGAQMSAVGRSVRSGDRPLTALAVVIAVAVLREGAEVVLFLYGIAMASDEGSGAMLAGGAAGLAAAAAVSWLLYRGLLAIPLRHLFGVTRWLIALLAAGMAGQAAAVLAGAGVVPSWGEEVWNTSWLLSDHGWLGTALHALVGYSARPAGIQVAAYVATLLALLALARMVEGRGRPAPARVAVRAR
jgi:high-affinity iron transporter